MCEYCDTNESQVLKRVTVTRQRHGQWYIFEDVPALVCPHCGHRYFDAEVLGAAGIPDARHAGRCASRNSVCDFVVGEDGLA
ncbi:MAG: YgiT-type zinc finger protein [Chloroflexi bacterium]|nr:YgiT-type zinc finger protein [Chloroflexota bacterium]